MEIVLASDQTKLVLGRGELFFNPFAPGTSVGVGEIYIGNTPEFTTSRSTSRLPVFDSFDGQKVSVEGPITSEIHTARFTTDHIDFQNLSLWYGAEPTNFGQNRQTEVREDFVVRRGRYYQIGATLALPMGVRNIEWPHVFIGATEIPSAGNWTVDPGQARLRILPDATDIADGNTVTIQYERRDAASTLISMQRRELFGALRFVGRNPVGPNKNYFYPCVKLSSSGDIDHKSMDWQRISFEVEATRRNPLLQYVYIDEVLNVGMTTYEYGIIVHGGVTLEAFPYWEDMLNHVVNVSMPSHHYIS